MQKSNLVILFFLFLFEMSGSFAQQATPFTQVARIKTFFNSALIHTQAHPSITLLNRNQWMGLEGAPTFQLLAYNNVIKSSRHGIGGFISRETQGISEKVIFSGQYAYALSIKKLNVNFGLRSSIGKINSDFTDSRLIALDGIALDPVLDLENISTQFFNVGASISLHYNQWDFGASIPNILVQDITDIERNQSKSIRHLYLYNALNFKLKNNWTFTPSLLLKFAQNSTQNVDFIITFYNQVYTLGMNVRSGGDQKFNMESIDFIIGYQLTDNIEIQASYDISTARLKSVNNGSLELSMRYNFVQKDKIIYLNPRHY